jgi:hypothetical protein
VDVPGVQNVRGAGGEGPDAGLLLECVPGKAAGVLHGVFEAGFDAPGESFEALLRVFYGDVAEGTGSRENVEAT